MDLRLASVKRLIPARAHPVARRVLVRARFRGVGPTDALLASYPKSGSTWLRFLLAQLLAGQDPDYASVRAAIAPVGRHHRAPALLGSGGRVLRTHEPVDPFPGVDGQPVCYLVRDARDVCVSYYNHRRRQGVEVDFDTFAHRFLDGRVDGVGPWVDHVAGARVAALRHRGPWLALRYEDLLADPVTHLGRVLDLLGAEASPQARAEAVAANSRERMRAKEDDRFRRRVGMDAGGLPPERRPFAEVAGAEVRARFASLADDELAAWGYRPTASPPTGSGQG